MNTFGKNLRLTAFGESHGKALGAIIDGCPAGIQFSLKDLQKELDKRKPGQSALTTARKENDKAEILSGVFENKTLGTPIAMVVFNQDQKSKDYNNIKNIFRPGHADEAWQSKFGWRDHRGGGRSSGRETIARIMGGVIAKKILPKKTQIIGHTKSIYNITAKNFKKAEIEKNLIRCADPLAAKKMETCILEAKNKGDSVGGTVEIIIKNCPQNIGEPIFGKLKALLSSAIFSLGAVFSLEIQPGFKFAELKGSEANLLKTGISGGIATGEDIIINFAVKPTPSISQEQKMKSIKGTTIENQITGRHDPCIIPRLIPVAESMVALVLADLYLEDKMYKKT